MGQRLKNLSQTQLVYEVSEDGMFHQYEDYCSFLFWYASVVFIYLNCGMYVAIVGS